MVSAEDRLTPTQEERGESRVFSSSKIVDIFDEHGKKLNKKQLDCIDKALVEASLICLRKHLEKHVRKGNLTGVMLISAEFSRRGIAPCFRYRRALISSIRQGRADFELSLEQNREEHATEDDRNPYCDQPSEVSTSFLLFCADAEWLVNRYPAHKTEWNRAALLFAPHTFLKTARYLHWDERREPGQIVKALALTEQQQRECVWLECLQVRRWRERLYRRFPIASNRIREGVRQKDRRAIAEQGATIRRRESLWLCAELAQYKPQRTADFFQMLTGVRIPRNVVAKQRKRPAAPH